MVLKRPRSIAQLISGHLLQVRRDNRDEVERNIREALEDFCRPENLERELRKAMAMLNFDNGGGNSGSGGSKHDYEDEKSDA